MVDETVWATPQINLKGVDKFNDYYISAYVTAGHMRMMLLHDVRNEDGIRSFFQEVSMGSPSSRGAILVEDAHACLGGLLHHII